MYITIEGVIGAGKTSLTDILVKDFTANPIYEIVEENPYLEKFYKDQKRYAFQTEMFFLTSRCNQMLDVQNKYLDNNTPIIADYNLTKSLIFSKKTLDLKDYEKFLKIYSILTEDFQEPDLIIVIKSNINTLKDHIKRRNREYEQEIEDEYLEYLVGKYDEYIELLHSKFPEKLLIISGDEYDFVNNIDHKEQIIKKIKNKLEGSNDR